MSIAEHSANGLGQTERDAIQAVAKRYEDKRAACVEALRLVQAAHRWVNDVQLGEVARLLDMSADDLDGVATYYNLIYRHPVGRHVILLCDSVSCWLMGCESLRAALRERLGIEPGATTPDGRFTLLPIVCLGHCDHAPAMMIGQDLHGDVDPARLASLLEAYV